MGQKVKIRWFWRKKKDGTRSITPYDGATAEKWKDIAERALKTFLQAFIASISVDAALLGGGWNVWRAALLSASAAGVSAVMNFVLACLREDESEVQ